MPRQMVHSNQRQASRQSQRLGIGNAHQQGTNQPRPLRHRHRVQIRQAKPSLRQGALHHRNHRVQMLA